MTSAISCPLWSSVYECQMVECCDHISGEDCVWYVCDVLYAVLYVLCQLLCSGWMCCLKEVYKCLQL